MSDTPTTPETVAPVELPDKLKDVKAKLTDMEKENFFKMFVSDQPYVDTEAVFGGQLKYKFATLSVEENNAVLEQQKYDIQKDIARNDDQYLIKVIQYRIAASLKEINDEPFVPNITPEKYPADKVAGTTYLTKRIEVMSKWPTFKLSNITEAFNRFERKVMALTEESFKETF